MNKTYSAADLKFLNLLSEKFPTIADATTEIINLEAILNLPKGTEHFLTDLHGEYEAFRHVLKNASGVIRQKVHEVFNNTLRESEMTELCTLIYYPAEKLQLIKQKESNLDDWYKVTLIQLTEVCRAVSVKYTRSKVRKMLPPDFSYVIQELLHESDSPGSPKQSYFNGILNSIISIGRADAFRIAMSNVIQRLTIDRLHIIGDIFDRGPGPHFIFDTLAQYKMYDIQWGNHDILWMGAACGNDACICNVIRNNLKYNNVEILENAYGISLRQLMLFGMKTYGIEDGIEAARAAITVMLFKLEGQLILAHPEYEMGNRLMLDRLDELQDVGVDRKRFPTVDDERPYALSDEETVIMRKLHRQFVTGQRLHKHVRFLYDKGGMYNVYNGNLLYHGCVPVDSNGAFDKLYIDGEFYHGRALLDKCDEKARAAYVDNPYKDDVDFMWFLWGGEKSPLCGRRLKTFEMEYVTDKSMWEEPSNPYYSRYYDKSFCCQILHEFGLYDDDAHIINGHTPVHAIEGENPVRANGKLFVIDGGFCRAMNKKTGIAGYTLIYNSHGLRLKAHTPFTSVEDALINNTDIETSSEVEENDKRRMLVKDTDIGKRLIGEIDDLHKLLENYRRL